MDRVQRIDDKLSQLKKPLLNSVQKLFLNKEDIFIVAAGFEDRSVEILKRLVSEGNNGGTAIVLTYLPSLKENKKDEITKLCAYGSIKPIYVEYDRHNPSAIGDRLCNILNSVTGNIFMDISAMSRLLIVQLVVALGQYNLFNKTVILYSEAFEYPPTKEEVDKAIKEQKNDEIYRAMFLSSGVFEVTIVPELSSVSSQGQPIRLVEFPSFNTDQLPSIRSEIQPTRFSIIHGIPPLVENRWRTEAIKKLNHIDEISNREDFDASTLDYRETLNVLLKIYDEHGAMDRIILAPTGSKMQALAVGIFRAYMKDVQVAYPTPREFAAPKDYTTGVRNIYILEMFSFTNL